MKRLVLLVVFVMFFGLLGSFAQTSQHQGSLQQVSARRHHHRAQRHHAHKAGRRHRARHANGV